MNRNVIIGIVVALIVVAGGVVYAMNYNKASAPSSDSSTTNSNSHSNSPSPSSNTTATGTSFTINANDDSADVKTVNVKKGDSVSITFNVKEEGTYYGGLQFKSDTVSSDPIKPGKSGTVTFTADKSFDFTPYWYESNVKKNYVISVNVS
jgi:hypothetical protein